MNSEKLIAVHLQSYMSMRKELGKDDPLVVESFGKLWDLIMVEIYFMKSVRYLLKDEEMSGFVIHINDDIRSIVDSYRPSCGDFMPYLQHSVENRAISYLRDRLRIMNIRKTIVELQLSFPTAVAESSPEEALCIKEERAESTLERKNVLHMLGYVCFQNPSRVRKLFVFLCTLLPFLSKDVVDRFCRALNCDRVQTEEISSRLRSFQGESTRSSRAYQERMVDYHWSKVMENEHLARMSLHSERPMGMAVFHRNKLQQALRFTKRAKMNVSYKYVAKIVNLDTTTVGLYVMHAKHILQKVLNLPPTKAMQRSLDRGDIRLPRFEPFREFKIDAFDKSA